MLELRPLLIILAFFPLCCVKVQAAAFEAGTEQVKAQLIASVAAVHPGDEILVGVHQRIIPHWHTYWKNPGDSGLPTTINYDLPAGATAGEIQWPTPGLIKLGPVTNYGYENEVTLLSAIKIAKDSLAGSVFTIKAKVKWLVCKEICIPQNVDLALDLPVVAPSAEVESGSPLIELARANLPVPSPWPITLAHNKDILSLQIAEFGLQSAVVKNVRFYPSEWGKIDHGAQQPYRIADEALELQLKPGEAPLSPGENLTGVLTVTQDNGGKPLTRGYSVNITADAVASRIAPLKAVVSDSLPVKAEDSQTDLALASALLLAFFGGVILNLMPCVFPVLSIKALALIKHAQEAPRQTRLHGLAYTVGILVSFALLGGILIALKAGGAEIGWGFQFQAPLFVLAIAYLMFAVGLNLSGVFSIGGSVAGIGSSLARRSGYSGSFFTGVLSTLVATPCTAPFMGAAVGFALTHPPAALLAIFLFLGLGLALPFLMLSQWPSLQRSLPKPGIWMDRLKQGLAFPMYGAAVWLIWVLAQQAGINAVAVALGGMVFIAFAAWLYEFSKYSGRTGQRSGSCVAGLSMGLALVGSYFGITTAPASPSSNVEASKYSEPYSAERLNALRNEGKPVFLNLTAAWCISCLANEKITLNQSSVIDAFKLSGITYLKGDWTNRDPEITRILADFGRGGVPLYVFYPASPSGHPKKPVVLPQILTPEIVIQTVTSTGIVIGV
ncbi:MAG: protein-disulfide reductase DsbD family protein [Methylococcales bacterium]|nr:protein-disulfide reductase DsbD family protein [Methylococcales bacterium]